MKKRYVFLALLLILSMLTMAACGDNGECDHEFKKWKVTQEPNCAGPGIQSRKCDLCGYTQTEELPATSTHTQVVMPAVDPSCTETGLTEGAKCSVCGQILVTQDTVPTIDHSYSETVEQEPSCMADGVNRFTCDHCGDSYTEDVPMPSYSATQIHDMTEASVGEVVTFDAQGNGMSLGSCFVYSSDGVIITNYHVIEGASYAQVTIGSQTYNVTMVLAYSPAYDLAVLQTDAKELTAIAVCTNPHAAGETVYAFGSSQGMTATFSQGIITNADREVSGVHHVQHDAAISSGNSGGPLINRFGEVIGINTWTRIDSQNLNFAVSVTELAKLDYNNPMTLGQVADMEISSKNPYEIMKEYITNHGDFYEEDNEYTYMMEAMVDDDGNEYISYYNYDLTYDEIELCLTINWEMYLYIYMDAEGVYGYGYVDTYGDNMYGYYDFSDFVADAMLPYEGYELNDSETAEDLCAWASYMAEILCGWLDYDLEPMGLTAEKLGIANF